MKPYEPWKNICDKEDCVFKKPKEQVKNEHKKR